MKIGIDARLMSETGVGRYVRSLLYELGTLDTHNTYIIFLGRRAYDSFVLPNDRWQKRLADAPWHSITEQLILPWIFSKERLDVLHVPYFNVPILYSGRFILTIHDLTILHFDTGKATTLPWVLYKLRRLGYRVALSIGLRRATHIVAVSETTKREIIDHFNVDGKRITVTPEGVDLHVFHTKPHASAVASMRTRLKGDYFLYVGNAYPHKNVEGLVEAFSRLRQPVKLVLVGKIDFFYTRLRTRVVSMGLGDRVVFWGAADDDQLRALYTHAKAFVFPSRMEGFGLPALEALASGCPVIASDIPIFHEILGDSVTYTRFDEPDTVAGVLKKASDGKLHIPSEAARAKLFKRYQWREMAKKTLAVYKQAGAVLR